LPAFRDGIVQRFIVLSDGRGFTFEERDNRENLFRFQWLTGQGSYSYRGQRPAAAVQHGSRQTISLRIKFEIANGITLPSDFCDAIDNLFHREYRMAFQSGQVKRHGIANFVIVEKRKYYNAVRADAQGHTRTLATHSCGAPSNIRLIQANNVVADTDKEVRGVTPLSGDSLESGPGQGTQIVVGAGCSAGAVISTPSTCASLWWGNWPVQ